MPIIYRRIMALFSFAHTATFSHAPTRLPKTAPGKALLLVGLICACPSADCQNADSKGQKPPTAKTKPQQPPPANAAPSKSAPKTTLPNQTAPQQSPLLNPQSPIGNPNRQLSIVNPPAAAWAASCDIAAEGRSRRCGSGRVGQFPADVLARRCADARLRTCKHPSRAACFPQFHFPAQRFGSHADAAAAFCHARNPDAAPRWNADCAVGKRRRGAPAGGAGGRRRYL